MRSCKSGLRSLSPYLAGIAAGEHCTTTTLCRTQPALTARSATQSRCKEPLIAVAFRVASPFQKVDLDRTKLYRARKASVRSATTESDARSRKGPNASPGEAGVVHKKAKKLLCLSNGHGEDAIAVAILKALKELSEEEGQPITIEALPLVGLGSTYLRAGIRTVGPAQMMPSGGFLYMDRKQIVGDLQAGLMALTWEQLTTLVKWTQNVTAEGAPGALLAVGDVLPLAMAWVASKYEKTTRAKLKGGRAVPYAFVGTAKSEFYVKETDGKKLVPEKRDAVEKLLSPTCVHLPWERALMSADECAFTAPRDALTGAVLRTLLPDGVKRRVLDVGNPMMDDLRPTGAIEAALTGFGGFRRVAILPGSRPPEVHRNFETLLHAADSVTESSSQDRFLFLAPIVPSLEARPFLDVLTRGGWRRADEPLEVPGTTGVHEGPGKALGGATHWPCAQENCSHASAGLLGEGGVSSNVGTSEGSGSALGLEEGDQRRGIAVRTRLREAAVTSDTNAKERESNATGSNPEHGVSYHNQKQSGPANTLPLTQTQNLTLKTSHSVPDDSGWPEPLGGPVSSVLFRKRGGESAILLVRGAFSDCAHCAEAGLAMAGTATEQLVGLGKPVFTVPGGGPQFTFAFAEAQSRLLGKSVVLCASPSEVGPSFCEVLSDQRRLAEICENGRRRMGEAGASKRLARAIWESLLVE